MKLDLKAVLGAGPAVDTPVPLSTPKPPGSSRPVPTSLPADAEPARLPSKPPRSPATPKPASRERVAVNVPGELLDFVRNQAACDGDYLTDVVLEALARHGSTVLQAAKDRVALRARPPRRSARQRGVKHPTLLVLYLSGVERRELDDAAAGAFMTRSAFVAELLALDGTDET
jgi:hypothetical protein